MAAKCVVVGASQVGKTAIVRLLCEGKATPGVGSQPDGFVVSQPAGPGFCRTRYWPWGQGSPVRRISECRPFIKAAEALFI